MADSLTATAPGTSGKTGKDIGGNPDQIFTQRGAQSAVVELRRKGGPVPTYTTQAEANDEASKLNKPLGFCPLIRAICRGPECVCYGPAYAHSLFKAPDYKDKEWHVIPPICKSPLISGVIEHQ